MCDPGAFNFRRNQLKQRINYKTSEAEHSIRQFWLSREVSLKMKEKRIVDDCIKQVNIPINSSQFVQERELQVLFFNHIIQKVVNIIQIYNSMKFCSNKILHKKIKKEKQQSSQESSESDFSVTKAKSSQRRKRKKKQTKIVHTCCFFYFDEKGQRNSYFYQRTAQTIIKDPEIIKKFAFQMSMDHNNKIMRQWNQKVQNQGIHVQTSMGNAIRFNVGQLSEVPVTNIYPFVV